MRAPLKTALGSWAPSINIIIIIIIIIIRKKHHFVYILKTRTLLVALSLACFEIR